MDRRETIEKLVAQAEAGKVALLGLLEVLRDLGGAPCTRTSMAAGVPCAPIEGAAAMIDAALDDVRAVTPILV